MATGAKEEAGPLSQPENDGIDEPDEWEYPGLEAIDRACLEIYPDQPNPLQATAVVKLWLGGPDPLDYISIYSNNGDSDRGIPAHWHYVSYGFSDLYGDGRVHQFNGSGQQSGFGFELTLRLKKNERELAPPMWPSGLMNRLANYVFQTGNVLHIGDHIPWHKPLDGAQESCIQHMLVTRDPQLEPITCPNGVLDFRQVVGVTDDEMKAAQKWKGAGVLDLMAGTKEYAFFTNAHTDGSVQNYANSFFIKKEVTPYFITDLERRLSIFEVDGNLTGQVNEGINNDGSNLGHVTAVCLWVDVNAGMSRIKDPVEDISDQIEPDCLEGVHLMFDAEAAELLPMVVRARLMKGRFFVFHNAENHAIHLLPPDVNDEGVFVNRAEPLKAQGSYLQMYCSENLLERMSQEFDCLLEKSQENQHYPKEFRFSDPTIIVSVSPRGQLFGMEPQEL